MPDFCLTSWGIVAVVVGRCRRWKCGRQIELSQSSPKARCKRERGAEQFWVGLAGCCLRRQILDLTRSLSHVFACTYSVLM